MKLQDIIEQHWYKKNNLLLSIILYPLSFIFKLIILVRKNLYKIGVFRSHKLPIPVVVVGNISVGGAGKTPLCKHIALSLIQQGINVGIILRGYGGKNSIPRIVLATDASDLVGDEALIYAKSSIPVAIGSDRYLAGATLLKAYPNLQIILSDDGLQHYALCRDYEIAVIDSSRKLGNQCLLPMGPLRESVSRLSIVNAIVINGSVNQCTNLLSAYSDKLIVEQRLILDSIYNPITHEYKSPEFFNNSEIIAMAGIGNPQRFFDTLKDVEILPQKCIAFPDHYVYRENDIPTGNVAILVTEKDYAKLEQFKNGKIWVVNVKSELNTNTLIQQICEIRKN